MSEEEIYEEINILLKQFGMVTETQTAPNGETAIFIYKDGKNVCAGSGQKILEFLRNYTE